MSNLLTLAAWYFVPNLVTGWVQSVYYRTTTRAGNPMPQPGSARFERHRRNIFVLVILSYLFYTIYEVHWELQREGNFYSDLQLPTDADEKRIQSRFRRLTVQYHPDKLNNPTQEQLSNAQNYYVHLKNARDTLVDPSKRFAYERFGSDILEWRHCITKLDYIHAGLKQLVPYYVISLLAVVALGFLRQSEYGRYYFSVVTMFVFEFHTVTRPWFPPLLNKIINPILGRTGHFNSYLPYQAIIIARRISLSVFIAVSQIAPRLMPQRVESDNPENQQAQLQSAQRMAHALDQNLDRLLEMETVPFLDDEKTENRLKLQLKAWMVQNEIRNDPGVAVAIRNALERSIELDGDANVL